MIIENDTDTEGSCPKQKLYAKAADFLTANVERVKQLVDGVDHRRILVLQVLLPEALAFAVRREFQVDAAKAADLVVYGLGRLDL